MKYIMGLDLTVLPNFKKINNEFYRNSYSKFKRKEYFLS